MEHVARGQYRLSLFIHIPSRSFQITIAADNLLCFRIPDNQLLVTVVTSVEFIDIHILAGTTASLTENDLTESAYLLHHVWRIMGCYHIYLVMTLISHTQLAGWCQFTLEDLFGNWLDNLLFHRCWSFWLLGWEL